MLQPSDGGKAARQSKAMLEGSVENYLMKLFLCLGSLNACINANESQVIPHNVNGF